ncbi:hypothetical protein D3C85_677540 [compost metagenome]
MLVELTVVVVKATEHGVLEITGEEIGLSLGVDGVEPAIALTLIGKAHVLGRVDEMRTENRQFRTVLPVVAVAHVLADGPDFVETVLEHIAQRGLLVGHVVERRVADVGVTVDPATRIAEYCARGGQSVGEVAGLLLVLGEKGQLGGVAGAEADRRGEVLAAIGDVVGLGVGLAEQAGQAVAPDALFVQRIAEVEGALLVIEVAGLQLHLTYRGGARALAYQVDLAAGLGDAIEHRAGAAQHFDAFQAVGLRRVPAEEVGQEGAGAVAQHAPGAHLEAAHAQLVGDELRAGQFGVDTGGVAQRLGDGLRLLGLDLITGHHGDGGRRLDQRGVGLGADGGALGHVTVVRCHRAVGLADDAGSRQSHRRIVAGTLQDHMASIDLIGDRRPLEQLAQRLLSLHLPGNATAANAGHGVLVVNDLQAGLISQIR